MTGASGRYGAHISDTVRAAARSREPDRYLAALLAPRAVRGDLAALAAFSGEILRIGETAREAMIGEIKLQWWRDALAMSARGARTGHPVADALGAAARRHGLAGSLLERPLEARSLELARALPADLHGLSAHFERVESSLFRLALSVLGCGAAPATKAAADAAGRAYGLARNPDLALTMTGASRAMDLGREAADALAVARGRIAGLDPRALFAFLPLAMVEPYLGVLERRHADHAQHVVDVAPIRRVWRIWRASRRGKI